MTTTFVLKGVNPANFKKKAPIIRKLKTSTSNRFDILNPGKISHVTSNGNAIRVLERGNVVQKDGSPYDRNSGKPCWWHRVSFDGIAMGIPIKIQNNKVYMDGIFCSYDCVYAFLLDHMEKMQVKRDPNFSGSIELLKLLYSSEFPGQILEKSDDWTLLKTVGNGNLSIKEYLFGIKGIRIVKHPNLEFLSVTVTYDIFK